MASIKIVRRRNKQRKDGSAPLALRISENYKTNYKFLGQYLLEKDWDKVAGKAKRSHPNHKKLNNFLMKKLTEANDPNRYRVLKEVVKAARGNRKEMIQRIHSEIESWQRFRRRSERRIPS